MKTSSLKQQISVALVFTGLIPLLVIFLCTNTFMENAIVSSEKQRIENVNDQMVSHVSLLIEGMASQLGSLQTNPIVSNIDANLEDRVSEMRRLQIANPSLIDINLYSRSGYLLRSTTSDLPMGRDRTLWFENALKGETSISLPNKILGEEELRFAVYLPLFNKLNQVENVIVARQDLGRVSDLIGGSQPGEDGVFVLLDQGGRLLKSSSEESPHISTFAPNRNLNSWKNEPSGTYTDASGTSYLYSAKTFTIGSNTGGVEWALLAMQPLSSVKALFSSSKIALGLATLTTLLLAIFIGIFVSTRISRHVVKLNESAQLVAGGDLDVKVEADGFREVRELADSFNLMISEIKGHHDKLEVLVSKRTENLKQSEKNLQDSSARLKAAFNSSKDGILVTDSCGNVIITNPVFSQLLDLPEDSEINFTEIQLRDHFVAKVKEKRDARDFLKAMLEKQSVFEREVNLIKEGPGDNYCVAEFRTSTIFDSSGNRNGRLWVLRDLTDTRLLEENLRQSQKLEAIGTLAGGVAHDFNNLLTGIYGHLSLLDMEHLGDNNKEKKELLNRAMHASQRASSLVKKLLGFSRRSHIDLRPCNAIEIVEETRDFIASSIDPNIEIDSSNLDPNAWHVLSDPSVLNQVMMNLSVNAVDAMGRSGKLTFSSENRVVTESDVQLRPDINPGEYLCLIVADNGSGIPESIQKQIFEPFFTTKEQGKGTGLGLATCIGIAQQLGGWIDFDSEVGVGTTFYVYIPRSIETQEDSSGKTETLIVGRGRNETLLLVDDEIVVRSVAEKLLSKMGYQIITASNGEEAINIFESGEHQIDLVLLDMTMPKKSGGETFTELRNGFDYVPIVICSGYLVDLSEFAADDGSVPDGFVQKPYKIEQMTSVVRSIIDDNTHKKPNEGEQAA